MDANQSEKKIIVGLGNPGKKYEGTRHNIGFECLNRIHRFLGETQVSAKFEGQFASYVESECSIVLLWPLTFMNLSGRCVQQYANFFKTKSKNILVVCDDLALPLGKLRFRAKGSSGGQNGLKDIIQKLGTEEFSRLRIGIDKPPPEWDTANYVLGRFSREDREIVDRSMDTAQQACLDWVRNGVSYCMNQYN